MKTLNLSTIFTSTVLSFSLISISTMAAETVWLQDLDLAKMRQGWGKPQINRSIREKPLTIAGKVFEKGVGTHAHSVFYVDLAGETEKFQAVVGVDDAAGRPGTLNFKIYGDGKKLWESSVMKLGEKGKEINLNVLGIKTLLLMVDPAGDGNAYDHANWAEARFVVKGKKPVALDAPEEKAEILTPKPGPEPKLNHPTVYGCRPGHPFIFRIPTTGTRPIQFKVNGLPDSLKLDAANGIISGTAPEKGKYEVEFIAENKSGKARGKMKIVSGDTLALTPPMGWNHWYAHYDNVTDKMMREATDIMIKSGMADVGYQYVNIDDCWMNAPKQKDPLRVGPLRDAKGNMLPNKHFPDMNGMTDYIHSKGLKAGIYTSPGPFTCAGFAGTYQHEEQDALQYAEWGFDFLKYDWCSYDGVVKGNHSLETLKKPYKQMGDILKKQKRDIVFNLCQYGMGNVWEWGEEVGGHCWRTAGDLGFELDRIFEVALKNASYRAYSKPGSWNDPDYIQIGFVGNADGKGEPRKFPLTPNEQYAFMSLWSLMASPIFYSGDMSQLDDFTINVLCNPEVIAIDQDSLGICAEVIQKSEETFVMVKPLDDGSLAVGLGNRGEFATEVKVTWNDMKVKGQQQVRDVWRQKNLGTFASEFSAQVPRHAVVLLKITPAK